MKGLQQNLEDVKRPLRSRVMGIGVVTFILSGNLLALLGAVGLLVHAYNEWGEETKRREAAEEVSRDRATELEEVRDELVEREERGEEIMRQKQEEIDDQLATNATLISALGKARRERDENRAGMDGAKAEAEGYQSRIRELEQALIQSQTRIEELDQQYQETYAALQGSQAQLKGEKMARKADNSWAVLEREMLIECDALGCKDATLREQLKTVEDHCKSAERRGYGPCLTVPKANVDVPPYPSIKLKNGYYLVLQDLTITNAG